MTTQIKVGPKASIKVTYGRKWTGIYTREASGRETLLALSAAERKQLVKALRGSGLDKATQ